MNFPSIKNDWKKIAKNNVTIALNVLYVKNEKHIMLMFQNITQIVKARYSFNDFKLRRITLSCSKKTINIIKKTRINIMVIFIVSIAFIAKTDVNFIKTFLKIKIFFNVIMLFEDIETLKFNQYQKSDKAPFIIHADL